MAKFLNRHALLLTTLAGMHASVAYGFEWIARPNLTMSEYFDDNLNLSQTAKQAGAVSEVTPGFYLKGLSPWSNVNLNYRLQGLYNAQADDAVTVNHQLQFNSTLQPVQNTLYLDTSASISQQNSTNALIATDNVSGRSRTQAENFNISPYFTPHFGQYATGMLKGGYARSFFDQIYTSDGTTTPLPNAITDSDTITKQIGLTSGAYFNVISWGLNYSGQNQNTAASSTSSGGDTRFESYNANARYFINQNWNLFAQGGYENNNYQTQTNSNLIKNGYDYTAGAQWKPSLWYSLEVGLGNNSHATIQYNPSNNLTSHVTYNYKTVGLNLGSTWDAGLNFTTQMSKWGLSYTQQTQTTQQLLAQQTQQTLYYIGPNPSGVPTVQSLNYFVTGYNLVNDVLITKTGNINFSYTLGKSTYNLTAYNTRRTYELSQEQDTLYGINGGWQWQFEPRWNYYLRPVWQKTNSNLSSANTDLYQVSTGLTRSIPINWGRPMSLNTTLDLRHIEETSAAANSSYIENRATASFFVQY